MSASNEEPLATAGVVIYSEGRFIKETIENLLALDYENFEMIICGSWSTDGSAAAESEKLTRYIRQEKNFGAPAKSISSLEQTSSKHFMSAAGLDSWESTLLGRRVETAEKNPDSAIADGTSTWIDRKPPLLRLPVEQARSVFRSDLSWIRRLAVLMALLPNFLVCYPAGRQ